ncbi:MAG: DNA helicase HerA-like ATPase [Alphaproteobacteria bacterium]
MVKANKLRRIIDSVILGGNGKNQVEFNLKMANRHGLIAGATGTVHEKITQRLSFIGKKSHVFGANPVVWDVFGPSGQPIRTTVSDIGPLLLSNLLELNETQSGVIYACFKIADDNGMLLLDLDDLVSMLTYMGDHASELKAQYGNIASSSIGAIQRRLMVMEAQGFGEFLGEPALNINDLMQSDMSGTGFINVCCKSVST